jgi:hypothetical protein
MKELVEKISSYHIFNYLLPGILFIVLLKAFTSYHIDAPENLLVAAFLYYFIGLVLSRIGSLVIEPIAKWSRFVEFADYKDFITAEKEDPQVTVLSETNNMYRSLAATFLVILGIKVYSLFVSTTVYSYTFTWVFIALFVMFLFAYKKQTSYVRKRVQKINQTKTN